MVISTPFPPEEGIGNFVYNLSNELIRRGHNIAVITRGTSRRTSVNVVDGIKVFRPPFIPIYPFHVHLHGVFVKKLIEKLGQEPDIVHIHTPLSPVVKVELPIISTFHGSIFEDVRHTESVGLRSMLMKVQARSFSRRLTSGLIEISDLVTAVSNSVAFELAKYPEVNTEPVVIGNGVDENVFVPAKSRNKENYVLFVGRLSYRKGLFDLLECARILADKDLRFVVVGKGELGRRLRQQVIRDGLQNKVSFVGHVKKERLIRLYQNASAFILPSHYEGLPTVLLEAMSCGSPVVATAIRSVLEVIRDRKDGILVPPKAPEKMAEAISTLIEDSKLRTKLGENARQTIKERYTWEVVAGRAEDCYLSMCE